jgi:hypothetical protein
LSAMRVEVTSMPCPQLDDLFDLILGPLESQSVYIFVDGVDAFPETNHNPERIARWISPLLDLGTSLSQQHIFLKLFLPMEVKAHLRSARQAFPSITLAWDEDFLVEILQSRISAASGNKFNSLDAKSSPNLREIEGQIVARLPRKLPREALALTKKIIETAQNHWDVENYITFADVEEATRLFKYEYNLRRPMDKAQEVGTS